ncbi:MAG: uracil-DNA glycosylase [Elusimicrobia bacterium]|nr:uracil-DNA glycosylase [Elusimicrobiota bacterium]MBD3412369.1 uracil-DNA glycosylase [Elusimicrobiota bacterium]
MITKKELKKQFKSYLLQEIFLGAEEIAVNRIQNTQTSVVLDNQKLLENFKAQIANCTQCALGLTRMKFVFGDGNPRAQLMFVGEGPGYEEDRQGVPFVGVAGQLLDKMINAMGMKRSDVYIGNVVKCHPMRDPSAPDKRGNDRPPDAHEMKMCMPYLVRQIEIIKPKIICALGSCAAKALLKTSDGITKLRGREYVFADDIILIPTYHPAALLRTPSLKKEAWEDLKKIRDLLKD